MRSVYVDGSFHGLLLLADNRLPRRSLIGEVEVIGDQVLGLFVCVIWKFFLNIKAVEMLTSFIDNCIESVPNGLLCGLHLGLHSLLLNIFILKEQNVKFHFRAALHSETCRGFRVKEELN